MVICRRPSQTGEIPSDMTCTWRCRTCGGGGDQIKFKGFQPSRTPAEMEIAQADLELAVTGTSVGCRADKSESPSCPPLVQITNSRDRDQSHQVPSNIFVNLVPMYDIYIYNI